MTLISVWLEEARIVSALVPRHASLTFLRLRWQIARQAIDPRRSTRDRLRRRGRDSSEERITDRGTGIDHHHSRHAVSRQFEYRAESRGRDPKASSYSSYKCFRQLMASIIVASSTIERIRSMEIGRTAQLFNIHRRNDCTLRSNKCVG